MLLTEFAEGRNEKPDTIRKYISRHKKEFEGHTELSGTKMEIDVVAMEILDKVYPLPKPIEIIEDTESRRKLVQAQELIIQMQQQMMDMQEKVAIAEATRALLEDKERQLEDVQKEKAELKAEIARKDDLISEERNRFEDERQKLSDANEEINRLKSRGLIERILNK